MIGDFEIKDEDLAGRIAILETKSGKLETPAFFPVINPFKTEVTIKDVQSVGFNNIITNAYIIKKNVGKAEDIHKLLDFNGIIMTDSGAYQILQYGEVNVSNREIVEYEININTDIGVFLDLPTGNSEDRNVAEETVKITLQRAKEIEDLIEKEDKIIWTHPIQGGKFLDLVEYSAKQADKNEKFKMFALGSPTVIMEKYDYDTLIDMIFTAKRNVSRGKPFHLFGGGVPHILPLAVALGVDTFDSASYIIYARDNRYLTRSRVYRLEELEYFPCSCPVCSKYTPKELLEMSKEERTRLLAIHNLYVIKEEINEIKQSIKEGRLFEYIQQKAYSHPAVYSAFKKLLKYSEYLEKFDPRVKGTVKGVFMFDKNSLKRPEVLRHEKFLSSYVPKSKKAVIICDKNISNLAKDADVYYLIPFYGLVPKNLIETFPYSQTEFPKELEDEAIKYMIEKLNEFLRDKKYENVEFIGCEKYLHINSIRSSST